MASEIAHPLRFRLGRLLIVAVAVLVLSYLILPQFVIVPLSFSSQNYLSFPPEGWSVKWYQEMLANPSWTSAAWNSVAIGVPAAVLSMIFGTLGALAVVRGRMRSAAALSALIVAPMMLPHVILAIGLYPLMLDMGLLGSYAAVIIGHTVVGAPLVFITVSASLAGYSGALELAAMTLGANHWRTFWAVTFPMTRIGILTGGILAFAMSFDELMLALFLTGAGTRTLPRLIWEQLNYFLTPTIAAVASLVFLFTLILLAIVAVLQARSGGSGASAHG